ncbi:leucine-rich repeat-containing protein 74B-like [Pectinophora gossypiella]|uniref:leucine-rich repeat-containing protein 74B-like n=1 Tax=Pectinophora gossypiella TaxID=13191 RepID=UPI00214E345B|nr:leucine-rich repeat-containing protein 74B-like [Pectinophora gossypiella]
MASDISRLSQGTVVNEEVDTLFENELSSSTTDPPMEEWSSLLFGRGDSFTESPKIALFKKGKYDPGSGEVCVKYITASDSEVLRHPYYNYPAVTDPGIVLALEEPMPATVYDAQGQIRYLELCKETAMPPVRDFYRGLIENVINLRYYGVNPAGVRNMCLALAKNRVVQRLDLTSSFLNRNLDACFHLGELLGENRSLKELILAQCRIGPEGLERLIPSLHHANLDVLDLSKNQLCDDGVKMLAEKITRGANINKLNLSYNNLGLASAEALARALEFNVRSITHLDLSWNLMYHPKALKVLVKALSGSKVLQELDLSWNAMMGGDFLGDLLTTGTLQKLNMSNNKLALQSIESITEKLRSAKALQVLNLSCNPIGPQEAYKLLKKMRLKSVKLQTLMLDEVEVTKEFAEEVKQILSLKHRANAKVTHGRVVGNYTLKDVDMRDLLMRRLYFLGTRGPKKKRVDVMSYFLNIRKTSTVLIPKQMMVDMKSAKAQVDEDLIMELSRVFPGPRIDKSQRAIDLESVVEYIARKWPGLKAPVTPPSYQIDTPRSAKPAGPDGKGIKKK